MLLFVFISGIGYWINRKKDFAPRMLKWHVWTTYIGTLLLFTGIFGHYLYDVEIVSMGLDIDHFRENKVNLMLIVFLSSLILTIGICIYFINLILSNFNSKK